MRRTVFLLLALQLSLSSAFAQGYESLYRQIDEAIVRFPDYVAAHERRIATARAALESAADSVQRYNCNYRLYELYKPFVADSAMFYLRQCAMLAEAAGRRGDVVRCRALLGLRCSNVGMYDEALELLDSIRTDGVGGVDLGIYYEAYNNVYNELAYYTRLESMKQAYQQKASHYEELMMPLLPSNYETRFLRQEQRAQGARNYDASLRINDQWLKTVETGSHPYALVALYRYIEFKERKDTAQMMHWLVESVLADIRNSAMDQGSMWELANELMLKGDVDRASRYISFTSDCANRYGSRQRNWQISPLLTDIAKNYKRASERTTSQLRLLLVVISVLALLLLGVLLFLRRRNKQLDVSRRAQKAANDQLAEANRQLNAKTEELSTLNERLSLLNSQLSEANQVKEEYIGRFMSLCSQYIQKLDDYRKTVNKMMKNRELDQLYQLSRSTELKEKELEELYENFDSVFLHLFPTFVDDFNSLLSPEVQVRPKEDNRLTTDLRIFALIRLGIEDSSKIAEFLHYSVNTIYNYRARIKNGALDHREQFEQRIKQLGMPGTGHSGKR